MICWPSGSDGHTRSSESGSSGRVMLMKCCASWDSSSDRTAIRRRRNTDGTSEKNEKSSSSVACSSASSKRAENIAQLPEGYSRRGGLGTRLEEGSYRRYLRQGSVQNADRQAENRCAQFSVRHARRATVSGQEAAGTGCKET